LEKRKAHYPLADVKRLIEERKVGFTKTALEDGTAMGFRTFTTPIPTRALPT
jgi:hypothetical protein